MHPYDAQIQTALLTIFRAAAVQRDDRFLKEKGFSKDMVERLQRLPPELMDAIARYRPFDIKISAGLLSAKLNNILNQTQREEQLIIAIKLGASRRCLADVANISDSEFSRLKTRAGVEKEIRSRPRALSPEKLDEIAKIHSNVALALTRLGESLDPLFILIRLSESVNLPVNQIYQSYYIESAELFSASNIQKLTPEANQ